jgi:hypothetical protein
MVIFVRELIWTYGGPTPHGAFSTDLMKTFAGRELDFCAYPYSVSRNDVAGRWTVIETFDRNVGTPPNLAAIVAHELGHDLRLGHGDGEDDDRDGRWDQFCDVTEANTGTSLMDESSGQSTTITPLQRSRAEAAARAVVVTNSQ